MKKYLICITLLANLITPAIAQVTFGVPDCGKWITDPSFSKKTWLLGYISGINSYAVSINPKGIDPLAKINSAEQIFLWMDNFCKINPLKSVSDGAVTLLVELTINVKK